MPSSNYIYFGLAGEFDPQKAAKDIELKPSVSRAKHSSNLKKRLPRCSLMRFAQTHAQDDHSFLDIYNLAETVVDQLEPYTNQFRQIIDKHSAKATFQVVIDFPVSDRTSTPVLGFSTRVIQFLSATNASIDIDTYRA